MSKLPQVIIDELAACAAGGCRIESARDTDGWVMASNNLKLECVTCGQLWDVEYSGGRLMHWDQGGSPHYTPEEWKITSKWPRGERQMESVPGTIVWRMRFVDTPHRRGK
jgi:hypothetical protein